MCQVKVANVPGQKVDHNGVKVQLLGQVELASERGNPSDFLALSAPLLPSPTWPAVMSWMFVSSTASSSIPCTC